MTDLAAENRYLNARLADAERRIAALTREPSASERDEISAAMTRADAVAALYGTTASRPVPGESATAYRKRLLQTFKAYSPRFKDADMTRLDAATVPAIEHHVFADAEASARSGAAIPPGRLVAVTERMDGRDVTKFLGDPLGWMAPFMLDGVVSTIARPAA